jgi:malonyl-CoA O-methyltransferase
MSAVEAREGYRRWAPHYSDETAISWLEDGLAGSMTPPLAGKRLLDAGCGTGRRLRGSGAATAVGVDLCPEMLDAGIGRACDAPTLRTMVGDVRDLPLADRGFDVVWCRLVIGHLADPAPVYAELARVADAGATVIVTDFHPQAWAAGHRRTFRDGDAVLELIHHVHAVPAHVAAARAAGLALIEMRDARIGPEVLPFYQRAQLPARYEAHLGLPVVLALAFRREG